MPKKLGSRFFTEGDDIKRLLDDVRTSSLNKTLSDVVDASGNQYVDLVMEGVRRLVFAGWRRAR